MLFYPYISEEGMLLIESFMLSIPSFILLSTRCAPFPLSVLNMPMTLLAMRFILLGLWEFGPACPLLMLGGLLPSMLSTKDPLARAKLPAFLASDLFKLTIFVLCGPYWPILYGLFSISLSFLRFDESSFIEGGNKFCYLEPELPLPNKFDIFFSMGRNFLIWEQCTRW